MSPFLQTILDGFNKYVFNDYNALRYLLVLLVIDTALGIGRSFAQQRFHSRGMRQMFRKLIEYAAGIVIAHVFCAWEIDGEQLDVAVHFGKYIKFSIYIFIGLIEVKSIDENMRLWWGGGLPLPKFLRRGFKDWEETGQFSSKLPPAAEPAQPMLDAADLTSTTDVDAVARTMGGLRSIHDEDDGSEATIQ